jgi:hypothetical protein
MPNVYVEPRPKGRPEGAPIEDYVLELAGGHHVLRRIRRPTAPATYAITLTPFQNATRPLICAAASLGSA